MPATTLLPPADNEPALRVLSLGAGVQSTTLLLLAALGELPRLDAAIFADTRWEPRAVYAHLDAVEEKVAVPAGIPVLRVSAGDIRADALDPARRFASMPLHILNRDGTQGLARRQCTAEYKLRPIKKQVRALLGHPHPVRVPRGVFAEQWIGISTDEWTRAKDADVKYMRNRFPLIELGLSREDCLALLARHGWASTPRSSCLGCPFHGNAQWRAIRDHSPAEWEDVVEFDKAIRAGAARATATGTPLLGTAYLHRSRVPLDAAPIDPPPATPAPGTGPSGPSGSSGSSEEEDRDGCSPWSCRDGAPVQDQDDWGLAV